MATNDRWSQNTVAVKYSFTVVTTKVSLGGFWGRCFEWQKNFSQCSMFFCKLEKFYQEMFDQGSVTDPGIPERTGVAITKLSSFDDDTSQWRIHNFPVVERGPRRGSVDSRGGYISKILYVKTKESGPLVGRRALGVPLDLPMHLTHWHETKWRRCLAMGVSWFGKDCDCKRISRVQPGVQLLIKIKRIIHRPIAHWRI